MGGVEAEVTKSKAGGVEEIVKMELQVMDVLETVNNGLVGGRI